jgi:hypothetical protein
MTGIAGGPWAYRSALLLLLLPAVQGYAALGPRPRLWPRSRQRLPSAARRSTLADFGLQMSSGEAPPEPAEAVAMPRRVMYERFSAMPSFSRMRAFFSAYDAPFGPAQLLGYMWPQKGQGHREAKMRVVLSLVCLIIAKVFIVRVPLLFKRCIDSLSGGDIFRPAMWMLAYAFSRALYTLLQELRYVLFTPVGQNALRRFMRDAFDHMQLLDAGYLGSQSTGELSRVFARGVRGMNSLLRLLVFNVAPTLLEALLVIALLGRRYGPSFLVVSLGTIASFVAWSLYVVEKRVALLVRLNDKDNKIFTKVSCEAWDARPGTRSLGREAWEGGRDGCLGWQQ